VGKRNDWFSLSLSSSFLVFEFFSLLLLLKALEWDKRRQKKGERERVLLSLFVSREQKISWKYLTKGKKEEKKHPFKAENILSSLSVLSVHREAGLPLSPVVVVVIISRLCEIQSSARRKKAENSARTQKIPISGGERKCCWAFYWSREVCLRARLSPYNFPWEGIFIGLFFST